MPVLQTTTAPHLATDRSSLAVATRNIRMMHFLARLAKAFNDADVPLMVLKGAAMQLTVYKSPSDREMCDLDLLLRPCDLEKAVVILESVGAYRSQILMRDDFFPKYYYEAEFTVGHIMPVVMDVHIRSLRPLRYVQLMPDDALWANAQRVQIGDAYLYIPCPEETLLHMTAHLAVHGDSAPKWREDICLWSEQFADKINWEHFVTAARKWHLTLPVVAGIQAAQVSHPRGVVPDTVTEQLLDTPVNWRDRLCLRQAPRDDTHPSTHVLINVLVTPGVGFVLGYLFAAIFPGKQHMHEWYGHEHAGWLPTAHLCRLLHPVTKYLTPLWSWMSRSKLERDESGKPQLVARHNIDAGKVIGKFRVRKWDGQTQLSIGLTDPDGQTQRFSMKGKMQFVSSSEIPNARFEGYKLVTIKRIAIDEPICIGVERISQVTGRHTHTQTTQTLQKAA
ncbi:MAG: nucleotidyltransferase family protein [Phycisphaeraceae bacterium]|nr:nucleotidyltransferase family protein [Phycisphaeraceae bacterium]